MQVLGRELVEDDDVGERGRNHGRNGRAVNLKVAHACICTYTAPIQCPPKISFLQFFHQLPNHFIHPNRPNVKNSTDL